jgi:ATP-dependent RNA helicase DDX18/HAS1
VCLGRIWFIPDSSPQQGYCIVASELRFRLLYTFLKRNLKKKVIVFMSSCHAVKYYSELLNYIDMPVMDLHGKQKQQKRTATFFEFGTADSGILICTDVAARGLDIPQVDWIIQFDPPDEPREYIHRVGRTARAGASGRALLFLLPTEVGFLQYLKAANVPLNEYEFPPNKVANIQAQLEKIVDKNFYLHRSARDGYRSYLQSYASHSQRDIFNVHDLDLRAVARSFGFENPPQVNLGIQELKPRNKGSRRGNAAKSHGGGSSSSFSSNARSGHSFSASNPHGQRRKEDRRQFTH